MSEIQFVPAYLAPAAWTDGAAARDLRAYATATLQVTGLSGGDTITVSLSLDGATYAPVGGIARGDGTLAEPIAADGLYDYPAGGHLKWARTGAASAPAITIRAGS